MGKPEVFELLSILELNKMLHQTLLTQQIKFKLSTVIYCSQGGNVFLAFDQNKILVYVRPGPYISFYFIFLRFIF